jgi:hypothetical protein
MTNPRGKITASYDGVEYALEMNWGVIADMQEAYQSDNGNAFDDMINGRGSPSFPMILRIVLACLCEANPDLDQTKAKLLSRKITNQDLFSKLLKSAFPDATVEENSGNGRKPKQAA